MMAGTWIRRRQDGAQACGADSASILRVTSIDLCAVQISEWAVSDGGTSGDGLLRQPPVELREHLWPRQFVTVPRFLVGEAGMGQAELRPAPTGSKLDRNDGLGTFVPRSPVTQVSSTSRSGSRRRK